MIQTHFGGTVSVPSTMLGKRKSWRVGDNQQIQFLPLRNTLSVKESVLQIGNYRKLDKGICIGICTKENRSIIRTQ